MGKMTDLQCAADLVARACPVGFVSYEENLKCQDVLDILATDILSLEHDFNNPADPEGLAALLARQQRRIESLWLDLAEERLRAEKAETELVFAKSNALLKELGHKKGQSE